MKLLREREQKGIETGNKLRMLVLETIKSIFRYVDVGKRKGKAGKEREERGKEKKMRKGRRKEKNERIRSFRDAAVITTS